MSSSWPRARCASTSARNPDLLEPALINVLNVLLQKRVLFDLPEFADAQKRLPLRIQEQIRQKPTLPTDQVRLNRRVLEAAYRQEISLPGRWKEDRFQVSSHLGNLAWAIISLIGVFERTGESRLLQAAERLGDWIEANCRKAPGPGFTGGWEGWEKPAKVNPLHAKTPEGQKFATWKSTEMNLDMIVAAARLFQCTGEKRWLDHAKDAREFVLSMSVPWDYTTRDGVNKQGRRFITGTNPIGPMGQVTNNSKLQPMDVNSWALLVLGPNEKTLAGIQWAEDVCRVGGQQENDLTGFDFNEDRDGIWWEGTGQMCVAYRVLKQHEKANQILRSMRRAQEEAPDGKRSGLVAATKDRLTTGFLLTTIGEDGTEKDIPWYYYVQRHLGATCWYLFAEMAYNPYWQIPASRPIPNLEDLTPHTGK